MVSIALAACLMFEGFPKNFAGVWATDDSSIFGILDDKSAQGVIGERLLDYGKIDKEPDGSLFGQFASSKNLNALPLKKGGQITARNWENGDVLMGVTQPTEQTDTGGVRFAYGKADFLGNVTSLDCLVMARDKTVIAQGQARWTCDWSSVSLKGSFSGSAISVTFEDKGGLNPKISGTLSYDAKTYIIRGGRYGLRGSFNLDGPSNGQQMGTGYATWAPTSSRLAKIRNQKASGTDQIMINLVVPGAPDGVSATLTTSK